METICRRGIGPSTQIAYEPSGDELLVTMCTLPSPLTQFALRELIEGFPDAHVLLVSGPTYAAICGQYDSGRMAYANTFCGHPLFAVVGIADDNMMILRRATSSAMAPAVEEPNGPTLSIKVSQETHALLVQLRSKLGAKNPAVISRALEALEKQLETPEQRAQRLWEKHAPETFVVEEYARPDNWQGFRATFADLSMLGENIEQLVKAIREHLGDRVGILGGKIYLEKTMNPKWCKTGDAEPPPVPNHVAPFDEGADVSHGAYAVPYLYMVKVYARSPPAMTAATPEQIRDEWARAKARYGIGTLADGADGEPVRAVAHNTVAPVLLRSLAANAHDALCRLADQTYGVGMGLVSTPVVTEIEPGKWVFTAKMAEVTLDA